MAFFHLKKVEKVLWNILKLEAIEINLTAAAKINLRLLHSFFLQIEIENTVNPAYAMFLSLPKSVQFSFSFIIFFSLHSSNIHVTPLPFPQYSPFIEFCGQLAWGVFQVLKALILTYLGVHYLDSACNY